MLTLNKCITTSILLLSFSACQKNDETLYQQQKQEEDHSIILKGGAALTICVPADSKSCPLTPETRNSTWGIFPSLEVCQNKEKLWKDLGASGDPRCVPCKFIQESYNPTWGRVLDCEWGE